MELCNFLQGPWKRQSLKCFYTSLLLSIIRYSCCTIFSTPSNRVTYSVTSPSYLVLTYKKFASKWQRMPICHIEVPIYWFFSATGICGPRYQMRSAMASCKDCTIPSLNVTSVWFCITLLTSKAHSSNETSPFWVESSLNVLNFGILPTACEATLREEIMHCGSDVGQGNYIFAPSLTHLPLSPPDITILWPSSA